MINSILGSKQRMSATFSEGARIPLTWVSATPCVVTQIKTQEQDGYWAIQLGTGTKKTKNTSKALQGHLKPSSAKASEGQDKKSLRYLREIRLDSEPELKVGDKVSLSDVLAIGDTVSVTGVSKGKGFAGAVKRWHFAGGSKTHGQSDRHRAPGSIGQGTTPGRVYKGKHMAGRMGSERKTIKNLKVVALDAEKNLVGIKGAIPGTVGSLVIISK